MDGARIIIMKDIELSLRMKTVADMVKPGGRVCDIGCDHAFVSIYLVANGISDRVIASDVRTGPCAIARDNIARWKMTDRIDLRLGNGLATISPGEVDSIIIAGMGGILITDILEAGMDVVQSADQLVLQPQSETEHVRRYIAEKGWKITEEKMLIDAGKYYVVLNVDVTAQDFGNKSAMDEVYYKYGYYLIHNHDKILREYLRDKLDSTGKVLEGLKKADTDNARRRAGELTHEKECMEEALRLISDME